MNKTLISIIIPVYNEEKEIGKCLQSLKGQSWKDLEIIVVDDGSRDKSVQIVKDFGLKLLEQSHRGPGTARNLGAKNTKGEILVFVDSDMTFEKDFIKDLVTPIIESKTVGTFSKNEMVANSSNIWSICWNINRNLPKDRMISKNYPSTAPVFRAILKSEFEKVGGFDTNGQYTDDWSLSRKLGHESTLAQGAIYYHSNPSSILEVWKQARWIGKNEFISGTAFRKVRSLAFYSLPMSFIIGTYKSAKNSNSNFLIFKIVYDLGVFTSVIKSFFGESKSK